MDEYTIVYTCRFTDHTGPNTYQQVWKCQADNALHAVNQLINSISGGESLECVDSVQGPDFYMEG